MPATPDEKSLWGYETAMKIGPLYISLAALLIIVILVILLM